MADLGGAGAGGADAMLEEYRAMWLAKRAGPAAAELAALVSGEFERLMATTD